MTGDVCHPLVAACRILSGMGRSGRVVWAYSKTVSDSDDRLEYLRGAIVQLRRRARSSIRYRELPVDPRTFVESTDLMAMTGEVYPVVMESLEELCLGNYVEAVLTGSIGSGKTTLALLATAYSLYELACMDDPHGFFDLQPSSEIEFVFQNLKKELSKSVDYDRFRAMIDNSPFFRRDFPYNRSLESRMEFPRRIIVEPLSGDPSAAIGKNVFGGVMDECLVGDSLVSTPAGPVRIDSLVAGDAVYGVEDGQVVRDRVEASRYTGLKDVLEVEFDNGSRLVGTASHPLLTSTGWVGLGDLRVGQEVHCAGTERSGGLRGCEEVRRGGESGVHGLDRARVVFVRKLGHRQVYNIETRRTHTYVANGVVVHNCNYMAVVERSKAGDENGFYDQALALYRSISRRRESRFMRRGTVPGMLCLVSSKKYPGEFTDKKIEEARRNDKIFVFDKKLWEVKPEGTFSERWFWVFRGDESRRPRILEDDEYEELAEDDRDMCERIPTDYRHAFEEDLMAALRDIGGVSTLAVHPFIQDRESVAACFGTSPRILSREWCDFRGTKVQIYPKRMRHLSEPRFAHVDLGLSSDSAGVAVGHVPGFVHVRRGQEVETLPVVEYDVLLEVRPPRGGEVSFEKIRELLYALCDLGCPVKWVTYDSWQSRDSLQILSQKGFSTGVQSVDATTQPYDVLKQALYDRRVQAPPHAKAEKEIVSLERDFKRNKIDHPPNFSKDVADAMAGVAFGLVRQREVWLRHEVGLEHMPASILEQVQREDRVA